MSTYCGCTHQPLHNHGHVDNLQELHLEHEGQHCGNLSLRHNWNVHHLDDELDLRHLQVIIRHGLLELTDVMLTAVSLYRAQGSAGAWVSSPEGGRHATATSSGQQLPKECRPSSDSARCPCRPLGPPATVTPGRLLVSPVRYES